MSLALRYSATSDVGRVRKSNQDSGFASEQLLVVADGMGGAAAGDVASSVTVQTLRRLHDAHPDDILGALAGAEIIEEDPSVEGMGTTVTAIMFDGDTMGLAHIGDSRAYLLRDGELSQLTADHTFVQGLVDEGRITAVEARTHPHRSLLLRALDVCSDGLCGYVDDQTIADALGKGTPDSSALELLQLALDAGGPDNITCVVGDVVDASTPLDPDSAAAATGPMLVGAAAEGPRGRMTDTVTQPALGAVMPGDGNGGGVEDPEELRYAPRAPRRFRWVKRIFLLIVVLGLLIAGGKFAYDWTQDQYYVADSGDTVAIYQGIQGDVPLVSLSNLYEQSDVQLETLPGYWRTRVRDGIDATDLSNAHNIVRQLQNTSRACAEAEEPTTEPSASPEPDQSASARPDDNNQTGGTRSGDRQAGTTADNAQAEPTAGPSSEPNSGSTTEPSPDGSSGQADCPGATS